VFVAGSIEGPPLGVGCAGAGPLLAVGAAVGGRHRRSAVKADTASTTRTRRWRRPGPYFQGGEAVVELVQSCASGNLAVLEMIERQHGRIGGLPDQDLSLRVTLVLLRQAGQ
jgi:hypothetical protein